MMEAAVSRSDRFLALTCPREKSWMKFGARLVNTFTGFRTCTFRGFVCPIADLESVATGGGFDVRHTDNNFALPVPGLH